ncbi:SseB family protein [Mangrovicoccus algicola]|uniref:SseB family protein n=1 Tax=Mangrovicoccus algicola TaxID=2771008 RepID=A0A8J6YXB1_9RHOB|nr:SseB family protein [Mangrovicoccus algicola]MBE3639467.1 SseB family protein [Mangrovicoccus algicola]
MTDAADPTPIDRAHARMEARPADDAARLRFYDTLGSSELFLLLDREAEGDRVTPRVFELETGPIVLVFDREARLAEFAGGIAPYAGMSGRVLVEMLAGQGIGLGVNLDVAPSAIVLEPASVDWLDAQLQQRPEEGEARPSEVRAPAGLPEALIEALDGKLATAGGLADLAYLVAVTYADGRRGHLLAFVDALPGSESALARAVHEALIFSGLEAGQLDVAFFPASDGIAPQLARVGLRFDLPRLADPVQRPAPGMNPEAPPILR